MLPHPKLYEPTQPKLEIKLDVGESGPDWTSTGLENRINSKNFS